LKRKSENWVCPWNAETWWVLQVAGDGGQGTQWTQRGQHIYAYEAKVINLFLLITSYPIALRIKQYQGPSKKKQF
jgi:hypothetical protein